MKPGQLFPNDLELAILKELAIEEPVLIKHLKELHVLSRKYTGVGCYTEFSPIKLLSLATGDKQIWLDSLVVVPGVKIGLGAVLFCQHGNPMCLEIYTFGDNCWDGVYSGFSIQKNE